MFVRTCYGKSISENIELVGGYNKITLDDLEYGQSEIGDYVIEHFLDAFEKYDTKSKPVGNVCITSIWSGATLLYTVPSKLANKTYIVTDKGDTYERINSMPVSQEKYLRMIAAWRSQKKRQKRSKITPGN